MQEIKNQAHQTAPEMQEQEFTEFRYSKSLLYLALEE